MRVQAAEHEDLVSEQAGDARHRKVAQVGNAQRASGQHHILDRRAVVIGASRLQTDMLQAALAQIPEHLDLEGGRGANAGAAAIALPLTCQRIRQHNDGTIEHIDTREALQQWDCHGVSDDHLLGRSAEHGLETGGGLGGEALRETLLGNRGAGSGGGLGQEIARGGGLGEEAEDQGLDEAGTGEVALALDKAGRAGSGVGDGGQHRMQCSTDIWYAGHQRLLEQNCVTDIHYAAMKEPLLLNLML